MNQDPLHNGYSTDEENAASAVASLIAIPVRPKSTDTMDTTDSVSKSTGTKRSHDRDCDDDMDEARKKLNSSRRDVKEARGDLCYESERNDGPLWSGADSKPASLSPAPYFYYRNHSEDDDDDPLSPLTMPGRVPNFPAKMHAILCNPDYADVITWMPHGRSWKVLKPRDFEARVIPFYFEHSKFSSFVRQTNGWGFRRVTQGRDRNSYYHEFFLRGLPHLCKKMRRLGTSEKPFLDPDHEPDFYKISDLFPLPETLTGINDETLMVEWTVKEGPKARMPVNYAAFLNGNNAFLSAAADKESGQSSAAFLNGSNDFLSAATKKESGQSSAAITDSVLSDQHILERIAIESLKNDNKNADRPSELFQSPPTASTSTTESQTVVLEQHMLENTLKDSFKIKAATVAARPNLLEYVLCNKSLSENPAQVAALIANENRRRQEQRLQIAAAQQQQRQLCILQRMRSLSSCGNDLIPSLSPQTLNPFGVSPNMNQIALQSLISAAAPNVQPRTNNFYNGQASSLSSSAIASHLKAAADHLKNAYALALNPSVNSNLRSSDDVLSKFLSDLKN